MKQLEIKPITPQRAKECEEYIQSCLSYDFDEYLTFFHANKKLIGQVIIDFYRLPKTPLHAEFKEKICKRHREYRIKETEKRIWDDMMYNVKLAQTDERFDAENDKKYKLVKKLETEKGSVLVIGIPYSFNIVGKGYVDKFAYSMTIMENMYPNLYDKIIDNIQPFKKS